MYSTSLKDNRYSLRCLTVAGKVNVNEFIIDTGARFTCCSIRFIDESAQEKDFLDCDIKYMGGLVRGEYIKFYRCHLGQFSIGNIDMGRQDICITFDKRISDMVVGMDILKQIILITNPYDQKMYFCKDAEDYSRNFRLTE